VREATGASLTTSDTIDMSAAETLTFDAERREVERIDAWIETTGRRWGANEKTIFSARLCVAELFANAIEHAGAKSGHDRIIVTLARRGEGLGHEGLGIEFLDTCAPFDPTAFAVAQKPDTIDAIAANGRGLMLIRAYAREFAYRHDGTYNRVTLVIEPR
jgi:serine/threonine-protein kinase RsbW